VPVTSNQSRRAERMASAKINLSFAAMRGL
jgi:hypothetical protein